MGICVHQLKGFFEGGGGGGDGVLYHKHSGAGVKGWIRIVNINLSQSRKAH